ncbi:MAG: hypothetical protein SFU25_06950, partial [Candidatus Caenarcaniphilales bacterium]|nr:hypothetical protein [Candidatus Caenarcaniphilales bacterium]
MPILRKNNFSENPDKSNSHSLQDSSLSVPFVSTMLLLNGLIPESNLKQEESNPNHSMEKVKESKIAAVKIERKATKGNRFEKLLAVLDSKSLPVSDAGLGKIPGALFQVFPKLTQTLNNNLSDKSISFFEGVYKALKRASRVDANTVPVISMPLCYVGEPE